MLRAKIIGHGELLDYREVRQTIVTAIQVAHQITISLGEAWELNKTSTAKNFNVGAELQCCSVAGYWRRKLEIVPTFIPVLMFKLCSEYILQMVCIKFNLNI